MSTLGTAGMNNYYNYDHDYHEFIRRLVPTQNGIMTLSQAAANITKFHSKAKEFRCSEKYTDVTVRCEEESFKCHRLSLASASNFFDTMFSSDFKESKEENITITGTNAVTFSEVLEFIYVGYVEICHDNVLRLLEASEFLQLAGIEELCVDFVKKNEVPISSAVDIFMFAHDTKKEWFVDCLSKKIVAEFETVSKLERFLEFSFDHLCVIYSSLPKLTRNEDVLFAGIVRWIEFFRTGRSKYFHELLKFIRVRDISPTYMKFILSNLYDLTAIPGPRLENIKHKDSIQDSVDSENSNEILRNENILHVCVKYAEENLIRIFSVASENECSISSTIELTDGDVDQWMKNIAMPDDNMFFYSLRYVRRPMDPETVNAKNLQSFHACSSVDMSTAYSLKPPPLIFGDVSMCSLQDDIYVYNQTPFDRVVKTSSYNPWTFDNEEIRRGIYMYRPRLDHWFPVPSLKTPVQNACMTAYDNSLFLIGGYWGTKFSNWISPQVYDPRLGKWKNLPPCQFHHVNADCCVIRGEIYVCGGVDRGDKVERFNPTAGKWEPLANMNSAMEYHRVISYYDEVWSMGSAVGSVPRNNLFVDIFKPDHNQWNISSILLDTAQNVFESSLSATIVDCFVFRSNNVN